LPILANLLVSLMAFVGLATLYSLTTPLFEAPDEVWHYAYVRHLAEKHTLPPLDHAESEAYQEVAQPPLYYAVAALVSGNVADQDLPELMWHNPGFGYQADGTVNDNKNMLVHTEREQLPWQNAVLAIRLSRSVSLAFGLLAVLAAWGLGQEVFPDRPMWASSVTAAVAFTPQFLFISGIVSNDSAAAALSTCALWAMARTVNRGLEPHRSLTIGLLVGLAALSKTSCLLLGLPALATVLAVRPRWKSVVGHMALIAAVALAVGGWWYARNALRYGDPLGVGVHQDTPWGRPEPASLVTILSELPRVYASFWGAFGWGHVEFPPWVYLALAVLPAASLLGWLITLKRRRLAGRGKIYLLAALWLALVFAALVQWMRQVEAPHGRLLFPAIGAWAVLLVGGWANLPRARLAPVFLTALVTLSMLTPWAIIHPAFAPPQLLPPPRAAATVEPVGLIYGGAARLVGIALNSPSAAPGETLAIKACWEAVTPMTRDYTVFIHLVGRDDQRVAERYTYPGLGRFPTSLWPVGSAFCDLYRVRVEDWAPAPELYDVVIGLYDASSSERLSAFDAAGMAVEYPALTQARVAPERPPTVSPQYPLNYKLGDMISLVGYDVSGQVRGGEPLTVTLYWQAEASPGENYAAFVHLIDQDGQPLAQHDGIPRYGRYPTSAWQPGDVIPDEHALQIPASAAGQPTRLLVGMYHPHTMNRLPVSGPDGLAKDNLIPLPMP
jgi:hypothetical protein